MRRIRANVVINRHPSIPQTIFACVLGIGFATPALNFASRAQAEGNQLGSRTTVGAEHPNITLFDELFQSDEREAEAIVKEIIATIPNSSRNTSLIAARASELVHDRQLESHVRVALLQILIGIEPATERSSNVFTAVSLDRKSPDAVRAPALEGLLEIGRRRMDLPKVLNAAIGIAQDRTESSFLRLTASFVVTYSTGADDVNLQMVTRIFKDSTEAIELRAGTAVHLSFLTLIAPDRSEVIAITLLEVGSDRKAARTLRLEALSACRNVISRAELFDVRFDRARAAVQDVSRTALVDELENLEIRVAAGKLMCVLCKPDKTVVDDLIKALNSPHAELQTIAARAIDKIGPDAKKARSSLVEIRDRCNISARLQEAVNDALLSLDASE